MASPTTTQSLTMQDFFTTTLSSGIASTDTNIPLAAVPNNSEGFLVIDPNNATTREIIYFNSKTSNSVVCPSASTGRGQGGTTGQSHNANVTVQMNLNSQYWIELQNGNANEGLRNRAKDLAGVGTPFVVSGGVWTGDALGSTKAASMTALTCYINGRKLSIGAVTARTFTASKDTYVDVLDNADNTGTLVYTEVTNNAASPALAANSIRIAIVVTGASNIAAAGSINQGSPAAVLPIASSVAYSVTDSLGNLIYNTNPNPTLIGYRQILANFNTTSTTDTQITGLSAPVIVPAGRKVQIRLDAPAIGNSTSGQAAAATIYDGVPNSGTKMNEAAYVSTSAGSTIPTHITAKSIPSLTVASSKTYNAGLRASANTAAANASASIPASITVELV